MCGDATIQRQHELLFQHTITRLKHYLYDNDGLTTAYSPCFSLFLPLSNSMEECRICYSSTPELIQPCMCSSLVHRRCLQHWRETTTNPEGVSQCEVCLQLASSFGTLNRHRQLLQVCRTQYLFREVNASGIEVSQLSPCRRRANQRLNFIAQ